jgi:hypothetical protein
VGRTRKRETLRTHYPERPQRNTAVADVVIATVFLLASLGVEVGGEERPHHAISRDAKVTVARHRCNIQFKSYIGWHYDLLDFLIGGGIDLEEEQAGRGRGGRHGSHFRSFPPENKCFFRWVGSEWEIFLVFHNTKEGQL